MGTLKVIALTQSDTDNRSEAVTFAVSQHNHDFLFPSERNAKKPMSGARLTDRLKMICQELGLDGIVWHTTRHTFATRLGDRSIGINTVKDLVRHPAISVTSGSMHSNLEANLQAVESLCEGRGEVLFLTTPANRGHLRALP